jgi:hypothetical protein
MRLAYLLLPLTLLLGASVSLASQTGMWWWYQNGDSVVLDGVTISLSGSGIQQAGGAVLDPPGSEDATLTFTFNPPIDSFQMFVQSVAPLESIQFQSPFPTSVQGSSLLAEGTPIQSVRGFFLNDENQGSVTWNGPGLASVTFTMAHADGSIQISQMGQAFTSSLRNAIEIDATPATNGVLLSLAISDAGRAPGVQGFVIQRSAIYPCVPAESRTVHCVTSRQPGTVSHATILDTDDVHSHTQYVYSVLGWSWIPCVPDFQQSDFLRTFDPTGWGDAILSFVSTDVEPVPIAHGRLVAVPQEGPGFVRVEPCADSCNPYAYGWASADVLQFVGTDTEVLVYGDVSWAGNAYGWVSSFTSAERRSCILSVRSTTWSQFKQLYRDR